jgi:la-related protein 1
MYDEFRHFAFDDAANNFSEVGLTNLIKFYGESLLSTQNVLRERVAHDYVDLVQSENEHRRPAFHQLQSAFRNKALEERNRSRIRNLLDAELMASLE